MNQSDATTSPKKKSRGAYQPLISEIKLINGLRYKRRRNGTRIQFQRMCAYGDPEECNQLNGHGLNKEFCFHHQLGSKYVEYDWKADVLLHEIAKQNRTKPHAIDVGDRAELYVSNIYESMADIHEVVNVGRYGDEMDLKYKFKDDEYRATQVKQMYEEPRCQDSWVVTFRHQYPVGSLLVFVNLARDRFALLLSVENMPDSLSFNFDQHTCRMPVFMYKSYDRFVNRLSILSKSARLYTEKNSKYQARELSSIRKIEAECVIRGLKFEWAPSANLQYDYSINGIKIQHKTCDARSHETDGKTRTENYGVTVKRYGWRDKEGKIRHVPYHEDDDFDAFSIELVRYPNQYFFIRKQILKERGVIRTLNQPGLQTLMVAAPHIVPPDWPRLYLNDWSIFTPPVISSTKRKTYQFVESNFEMLTIKIRRIQ